jgi:hypothetical protein
MTATCTQLHVQRYGVSLCCVRSRGLHLVGDLLTGEATGVLTTVDMGGLEVDNAVFVKGKKTLDCPTVCDPSADSHVTLRPLATLVQSAVNF